MMLITPSGLLTKLKKKKKKKLWPNGILVDEHILQISTISGVSVLQLELYMYGWGGVLISIRQGRIEVRGPGVSSPRPLNLGGST